MRQPKEWGRSRLDTQSRVVIPAAVRRAMGVSPGDPVVMTVDSEGRLVIEKRDAYLARLQKSFGQAVPSVDEFLEGRRSEAARERKRAGEAEPRRRRAPVSR